MKFTKVLILLVIIAFGFANAQSDYEYVQKFKAEARSLKSAIEKAETLSEVGELRQKIRQFKDKYYARKDFLNAAIYPDKFETILSELNNALDRKSKTISKLAQAEAKINELSAYLDRLSKNYMSVLDELETMKSNKIKTDAQKETYERRIEYLKKNIAERDKVLRGLLDTLLHVKERSAAQGLETTDIGKTLKIKDENFLRHLEKLISDNIGYLRFAEPSADEIFSIYDEQKTLSENLAKLDGDELSVLLKNETAKADLTHVKTLNSFWGKEIEKKIVNLMGKDFAQFGIELNDSSGVADFYGSLLDYAEKESVKAGNKYEREHKFKTFSESAWNGVFKKKWADKLLQRGLITPQQIETVDILVKGWGKRVKKSPPYFLYIFVTVIVMFITIYIGAKAKKSKYKRKAVAQKKKNEYDKKKREKEIERFKKKNNMKDS